MSVNVRQISANYLKCFLSAKAVLLSLFKGNLFVVALIGKHSFTSLSFKELVALGSSNFTHTELQSGFDLMAMYLAVPIEPLINPSETLTLSV